MPLPLNVAISGFLGDLRKQAQAHGWSLEDLEQRAGLPAGYLSIVESLQRPPSKTACGKLAQALGISPMLLSPWLGPETMSVEKPNVVHELHDLIMLLELLPDSIRGRTITRLLGATRLECRQTAATMALEAQANG